MPRKRTGQVRNLVHECDIAAKAERFPGCSAGCFWRSSAPRTKPVVCASSPTSCAWPSVRHGRYITFQLAEVAISRALFADILRLIDGLQPRSAPT